MRAQDVLVLSVLTLAGCGVALVLVAVDALLQRSRRFRDYCARPLPWQDEA